jgi:hypothetical protein
MIVERRQRRKVNVKEQPKDALQTTVTAYLAQALPKTAFFCVFPAHTGAIFHGMRMRELGARAGFPTVLVLHDGRAYCIELKADSRMLQPDERDCHAALQDARVPVAVARSLDDVQRFLIDVCALPMRNWRSAA